MEEEEEVTAKDAVVAFGKILVYLLLLVLLVVVGLATLGAVITPLSP